MKSIVSSIFCTNSSNIIDKILFLFNLLISFYKPESVPQQAILSNISAEKHLYHFGKKFGLKICPDNDFSLSEVAGCPKETSTFCFYYCSVREIAEAVKVFDFFDFHFLSPFDCLYYFFNFFIHFDFVFAKYKFHIAVIFPFVPNTASVHISGSLVC